MKFYNSNHTNEGIIVDVIGLLKTLLHKDSQYLIQNLTQDNNAGDKTSSSNLQSEERGLLFTIHTQFVLFNLNINPEFMMNFGRVREMVLQYLKNLFKVRRFSFKEEILVEKESNPGIENFVPFLKRICSTSCQNRFK